MGDAGSERSKAPSLPPRCPCGFWGSSKTMNLCSKCFADFQKKQPDDDSTPSTSNSQSDLFSEETTSDNKNTSLTTPTLSPSQQPLPTELNVTAPSKEECGPCTDTAHVSLITPTKRSCGTGTYIILTWIHSYWNYSQALAAGFNVVSLPGCCLISSIICEVMYYVLRFGNGV
nr:PREDICTED: AN1-type zinc finger protein 3-like [Bos indicus]